MTNIIQFPGKKGQPTNTPPTPSQDKPTPKSKLEPKQKVMVGAVLSILLATLATNRIVYNNPQAIELSSVGSSRSIASVNVQPLVRDASWEKSVAESLASADIRGPASFNIGRPVTVEEQLQLGSLQGVYTTEFTSVGHHLRSISLQGEGATPAYLAPEEFFKKYGVLIDPRFKKAVVSKAPLREEGRVTEIYNVIDSDNRPVGEAHFQMDRHGRLLSLEVKTPLEI